ncbi:MAG: type II toxin-antitoxin system HicA family toxin [Nanoarchaeota archaeon]|nr:type II toxin-antitoxin system HicA family toxin [Nanoarchaeota archaeon]
MPKLPIVSGKDVVKALSKIGFNHIRTHGSHAILTKQDPIKGKITVPVPLHKELAKGTLKSIMRQTDVTLEQLLDLL